METPLRILHIEDSGSDAEIVAYYLKQSRLNFVVKVVDNKAAFTTALQEFRPEIIISDHSLPQFDSLSALEIFKETGLKIPFILVTGTVSEEFAVTCLKAGADDYILKTNLTRLPSAIRHALKKKETERERDLAIEKLNGKIHELDTFMYKASHDLKGPLASMAGLIEIAREEKSREKTKEYLEMIAQSNKKLERILADLIEVTKIAQGKMDSSSFDLKQLVEDTIVSLRNIPQAAGMQFRQEVDLDRELTSDKNLIGTIIQNLVHNAILYRKTTGGASYVRVKAWQKDALVFIEVSDNGIGISSELQEKIFDMFFRGNHASKGTGLGLYIVRQAVEKLKGKIILKSKPLEGSSFTVVFP